MSQAKLSLASEFRKDFTLLPEESFIIFHTYLRGNIIPERQCMMPDMKEECTLAGFNRLYRRLPL